jgi:predicted nucleic acid-binding protein
LPLTDLIIACCALRVGATVVTSDEHFKDVPGVAVAKALPRT